MIAIKNGRLATITGGIIDRGVLLIDGATIKAIGKDISIPREAEIIDAASITAVYTGPGGANIIGGIGEGRRFRALFRPSLFHLYSL
jgi:dihydroorotase-like cyclic amidohydrolase